VLIRDITSGYFHGNFTGVAKLISSVDFVLNCIIFLSSSGQFRPQITLDYVQLVRQLLKWHRWGNPPFPPRPFIRERIFAGFVCRSWKTWCESWTTMPTARCRWKSGNAVDSLTFHCLSCSAWTRSVCLSVCRPSVGHLD